MHLTPDVALALNPITIRPGLVTSTITAALTTKDNKYTLKPLEDSEVEPHTRLPTCYPYGNLNVDELVQRLAQAGLADARVDDSKEGLVITLANDDVVIQINEFATHIISANSALREKLRDILLECLGSF